MDLLHVAAPDRGGDLADLLLDLGEAALPARPVEADLAAAIAELLRADERRRRWDAVEPPRAPLALGRLLGGLDLLPLHEHLAGGVDALRRREHVRVAVNELVADRRDHVVDVERAFG